MQAARPRYALHASVAVRWWLTTLPHADLADRLLHGDIASSAVYLSAPESLMDTILEELARALGPERLIAPISGLLFDDVRLLIERMVAGEILQLTRHLARPAFLIATAHNIQFADALVVAQAEAFGWPVLLADEDVHARLMSVAVERPALRVIYLRDYYNLPR